jgi:hypothetical protein
LRAVAYRDWCPRGDPTHGMSPHFGDPFRDSNSRAPNPVGPTVHTTRCFMEDGPRQRGPADAHEPGELFADVGPAPDVGVGSARLQRAEDMCSGSRFEPAPPGYSGRRSRHRWRQPAAGKNVPSVGAFHQSRQTRACQTGRSARCSAVRPERAAFSASTSTETDWPPSSSLIQLSPKVSWIAVWRIRRPRRSPQRVARRPGRNPCPARYGRERSGGWCARLGGSRLLDPHRVKVTVACVHQLRRPRDRPGLNLDPPIGMLRWSTRRKER